jgi:hypothetical protein
MTHLSEISGEGTRRPAAYDTLPKHLRPLHKRPAVFDCLRDGLVWLDHAAVAGFFAILQAFVEGMNTYVGNAHHVNSSVRHDNKYFENE